MEEQKGNGERPFYTCGWAAKYIKQTSCSPDQLRHDDPLALTPSLSLSSHIADRLIASTITYNLQGLQRSEMDYSRAAAESA